MAATITHELTLDIIRPSLVQTRTTTRTSRSIAIPLANSTDSLVVLRGSGMRTGEHILFFDAEQDALDAVDILGTLGPLQLTYPDVPAWEMRFAVVGDVELQQDEDSLVHWTVRVGFQELSA